MIAKLLIHPNPESRILAINEVLAGEELKRDHPDVLWIGEEEKLGVEAAKKIRQHLSLKPYSARGRAVVVTNSHEMTLDAQDSLLKTLEEPPIEAVILLGADSDRNILPTVLSRVSTVILGKTTDYRLQTTEKQDAVDGSRWTVDIDMLLSSSIEQRIEYIEKLESREAFFHGLLTFFHGVLKSKPKYLDFSKDLLEAEAWKESNVNIRAILEYLMLKLPNP